MPKRNQNVTVVEAMRKAVAVADAATATATAKTATPTPTASTPTATATTPTPTVSEFFIEKLGYHRLTTVVHPNNKRVWCVFRTNDSLLRDATLRLELEQLLYGVLAQHRMTWFTSAVTRGRGIRRLPKLRLRVYRAAEGVGCVDLFDPGDTKAPSIDELRDVLQQLANLINDFEIARSPKQRDVSEFLLAIDW